MATAHGTASQGPTAQVYALKARATADRVSNVRSNYQKGIARQIPNVQSNCQKGTARHVSNVRSNYQKQATVDRNFETSLPI